MKLNKMRAFIKGAQNQLGDVLAMNRRNLHYIYPNNPRRHFGLADDKLATKKIMEGAGVAVPRTLAVFRYFHQLSSMSQTLGPHPEFVIKPAHGKQGGGILVVAQKQGEGWLGVNGHYVGPEALRLHLSNIIFGIFSQDMADQAIVEERIHPHPDSLFMSRYGLADLRIITFKGWPVMAMARVPTARSNGKANLHQGAVGVGIDMETGTTTHAIYNKQAAQNHPDSGEPLVGRAVPLWDEAVRAAVLASAVVPLEYLGVDLSISDRGVVLLEINVRPGLEIQNANLKGLGGRLAYLESQLVRLKAKEE